MSRAGYVCFALLVPGAALVSCRCDEGSGPQPAGSASASATAVASAAPSGLPGFDNEEDEVKPVYPQTNDPPDPRATKYCDLVYELQGRRRKECCPDSPFTVFRPTAECVRTLSYALRSKAVAVEDSAMEACEKAAIEEAKQCDWGGTLPAACQGLFTGQIAEKEVCRSALECKTGLECRGLGATTPGKCAPPRPKGVRCGGVSDTLGAFTRQDVERGHAECEGYCKRRICADAAPLGARCDAEQSCARGLRCDGGKCTDSPLPGEGQPCASGVCQVGVPCVDGKCTSPKRLGEECSADKDCRSQACATEGPAKGKCEMRCGVLKLPREATASPKPSAAPKR